MIELRGDCEGGKWVSAPSNKVYWPPAQQQAAIHSARLDSANTNTGRGNTVLSHIPTYLGFVMLYALIHSKLDTLLVLTTDNTFNHPRPCLCPDTRQDIIICIILSSRASYCLMCPAVTIINTPHCSFVTITVLLSQIILNKI